MRKSDKKIDNTIRDALTALCEIALDEIEGFKWITHLVDYKNFPESLAIICVFETDKNLLTAQQLNKDQFLLQLIQQELASYDINIKNIDRVVRFHTEANMNARFH